MGSNFARITLESFLAWKKAKIQERQATEQKERDRKCDEFKAGRSIGLSGRDMFTFRPELAEDDDQNEDDEEAYDLTRFEGEEDGTQVREITLENLMVETLQGGGDLAAAALASDGSLATSVPIDERLFEDDEDLDDLEEDRDRKSVV